MDEKNKTISVNCEGTDSIPLDDLVNFQGKLKTLSKKRELRLRNSLINNGFCFPVFVWRKYILDGHQRLFVLKTLIAEGYSIDGDIPVVKIPAKNKKEAAKKLLLFNARYAEINKDGARDFLKETNVDLSEFNDELLIPEFNIDGIVDSVRFGRTGGKNRSGLSDGYIDKIADICELAPNKDEEELLEGKQPIIEFSGGKDSTAALIWTLHFCDIKPILIYISIGADHPSIFRHIYNCASFFECELVFLASEVSFFEQLHEKGWPEFRYPWCHDLMHNVCDDYIRDNFDPDGVVVIRGGRDKEKARHDSVKHGRVINLQRIPWPFFNPFARCTKEVCSFVLEEAGAPLWPGYNYGLQRTACWCCPGQSTVTYAALRYNFPSLWEELLEYEDKFGIGAWQKKISFAELAEKGAKKLSSLDIKRRKFRRKF